MVDFDKAIASLVQNSDSANCIEVKRRGLLHGFKKVIRIGKESLNEQEILELSLRIIKAPCSQINAASKLQFLSETKKKIALLSNKKKWNSSLQFISQMLSTLEETEKTEGAEEQKGIFVEEVKIKIEDETKTESKRWEASQTTGIITPNQNRKINQKKQLALDRKIRLEFLLSTHKPLRTEPPCIDKTFPKTRAWVTGKPLMNPENHKLGLVDNLARIGQEHNIPVLYGKQYKNKWVQDGMDFTATSIKVPAPMKNHEALARAVKLKRQGRATLEGVDPNLNFGSLGQVARQKLHKNTINLANSMGIPMSYNLTYNEGGNTLIGKEYVIVGKDSKSATEINIENEIGRKLTEEELKLLFAEDYGVSPEAVYFIEQPADFHLDMAMHIVGEKTVILNDSVTAMEKMLEIHKPQNKAQRIRAKKLQEQATLKKQYEDLAEKDLKAQGFTVIRIPGKLTNPLSQEAKFQRNNFFNLVSAMAPSGKKLILSLHVDQHYKTLFHEHVVTKFENGVEFHFLSEGFSKRSLAHSGGISCQVKTM